ncbi:phosphatidylglycerol lysyltransferase domain-containing protein [Mesorhizobium sp. WSM4976]|uniref:phosphatidylglycerol lysyltransferase domain-containing protein n=1 Tax=Mesorhizobium sp. WSM4976 TaxID=3038549 RepID=UPI0024178377|nr:phosphatidylglycerol lysyltransferase domain-containing protein [Mesorhizobium sp. WSM4976]MDG4893391.1 phosphatidylglycerol lysyltransferase domain-containing protein [Mesorhizobium sp. WSM4976]
MAPLRIYFDRLLDAVAPKVPRRDLTDAERLALVRRYGDFSLAYSTAVQQKLSYFSDGDGYIAFGTKMSRHFALGDPVADPADRPAYIRRFVEAACGPWFVQIGADTAKVLAGLGYKVNRLGMDTRLLLPEHDFSGKRNETVRYSERWLAKKGFVLAESTGDMPVEEIMQLSADWRKERIIKRWEMGFLNRRFSPLPEADMRRFVLHSPEGRLLAILDFDPLFRNGKVFGYTTSFKRKQVDATPHAEIGLTKFAVDRFREEGVSAVTLGLSPLLDIEPSGFAESDFWRSTFQRAYQSRWVNRSRFNLQGQAAFKRRFHGVEEPTYIAFRKGTFVEMLGLLRLTKAI